MGFKTKNKKKTKKIFGAEIEIVGVTDPGTRNILLFM
jgi:hypothetical protein